MPTHPYYKLTGYSSGNGGFTSFTISAFSDDGNGPIQGWTEDQLVDALRDALAGFSNVTSVSLDKYTETITPM